VSRLPAIGETLRSAREAQGRTVEEASAATRIRAGYLEALEQERFEALGGSVYAKGFLRAYASWLGLDPSPLLDAYRLAERPEGPLFERAPRAVGGLQSRRHGPSWLTVAIVCVSVILAASIWSLLRPASDTRPGGGPVAQAPATSTARAVAPASTVPRRKRPKPAPAGVTVALKYAAACWTKVTVDGREAFRGTPTTGERRFRGKQSIALVLGAPSQVRLTVDGKDVATGGRAGAVWQQTFTAPARR
jgi:cytoskeletal protein RodZ